MAILEAVFANKAGQTPQEVERRRRMAQALVEAGSGGKPPSSGLELAGRLAMTLTGQYQAGKAERQDAANRSAATSLLTKTLLGDDPYSPSASGSPIPVPDAAGEMKAPTGGPAAAGNPDTAATEAYIREAAAKRGIDPEVAVKVARSEGLAPGVWQSNVIRKDGKRETSYGPFQLLTGGGLGDKFQKIYGKSPADPSTVNQQIDFALDEAARGGWSPWYGAAKVGVGARTGLDRARALGYQPQQAGQEVASLDPAAGMQPAPIQPPVTAPTPSPTPGYVDPMVTNVSRAPTQGPTHPAPALPPPTTIASAPQVASVPQQQSIMGSPVPGQQQAPQMLAQAQPNRRGQIAALLQNPYTQEMGQQMLMEEYQRQQDADNLILKQKLQQSDPKYQTELQKSQIELQNLREPKMTPAEQATNAREQEKMKFEREKFDREVEKGQWQKLTDGRLYNQTTGDFRDAPPPVPGSVPPKFDDISNLRKEIHQLPSYKNVAQALPIYRSMAETAGRNSKASDLNLVYGLGKIMDPTSVVREGEMVMVKNTASLPDWLQGAIASLNGGAALTPETRQAIMTEAYGRIQGYDSAFKQDVGQYQGIVERNKFNPADVIPDFGGYEPWKAAPDTPQEPAAPTQIQNVDDYNALPKGAKYLDPNGKLRTKQ